MRHRKFLLGHNFVFLALAVRPIRRGASADRISHRTLDSGALDCCAGRLRGLGGMAQLVAGLWLIATPWLFSFEDSKAITVEVLIGTAVAALAAFEVWLTISHRLNGGDIAAQH